MTDEAGEKPLSSRLVYDGRLLRVHEDRVRLPNGRESGREYIRHPGAAAVLALPDDRTVLLVRQYRYPVDRVCVELPAGKLDPGETPLTAAGRELAEETGYSAADWQSLGLLHPTFAYSDEVIHLFLARDLTRGTPCQDADESLEVFEAPLAEAFEWVEESVITDAKTVVAFFRLLQAGMGRDALAP